MNQRTILLLVIAFSILAAIALNNAHAEKKQWFDARNFYKEINKMDMFDKYPYDSPQLTVKIVNLGAPITDRYLLEYMGHNEIIKSKEWKKDSYKTKFDVGKHTKVCLINIDTEVKKCKSFESFDEKSSITFYIR
jgi:hypothetical protein